MTGDNGSKTALDGKRGAQLMIVARVLDCSTSSCTINTSGEFNPGKQAAACSDYGLAVLVPHTSGVVRCAAVTPHLTVQHLAASACSSCYASAVLGGTPEGRLA